MFAIGDDGNLWRRWWDGAQWVPWQAVAEPPLGVDQLAASWVGDRLDLYARDAGGDLWYIPLTA